MCVCASGLHLDYADYVVIRRILTLHTTISCHFYAKLPRYTLSMAISLIVIIIAIAIVVVIVIGCHQHFDSIQLRIECIAVAITCFYAVECCRTHYKFADGPCTRRDNILCAVVLTYFYLCGVSNLYASAHSRASL